MTPTIRLARTEDAGQIQAIYAPIVSSTVISFELEPPTVEEMHQRILTTLQKYPWLVCERDREILGYAYASEHRTRAAYQWCVDVSVYVNGRIRRAGIGRALYISLLKILRVQGFYNAYAGITLPNPASVGLHDSLGFTPIGVYRSVGYKLGKWHDVGWWHLALKEPSANPELPVGLNKAQKDPEWESALAAGVVHSNALS